MISPSNRSYLKISEAALDRMRMLLAESSQTEPVIVFCTSHAGFDAMALAPESVSDADISRVSEIVGAPDFFRNSTVVVDTVARETIPDQYLFDFGGVLVNAPLKPKGAIGAMVLSFAEGRFWLELERG